MVLMSKMSELHAKAEMILMGCAQRIEGEGELRVMLDYFKSPLNVQYNTDEIIRKSVRYCKNPRFKSLSVNMICGMRMIAIGLETDEDEETFDLLNEYGVFGYVYNIDAPDCSELGYSFYQKDANNFIRRVG